MPETHRDLVVIRNFADSISAHIAQAALDAHDIRSVILGDDAGGLYPALTFAHGVRLAVQHANAVRALRILDAPAGEADWS
ncbi:MAG: hypothetical protein ACR2MQ_11345 [Gemmatimonadaceae bacterium]